MSRPRNTTADERIKELMGRKHGGKFIYKRLMLDGYKISLPTVQRRVREFKQTKVDTFTK